MWRNFFFIEHVLLFYKLFFKARIEASTCASNRVSWQKGKQKKNCFWMVDSEVAGDFDHAYSTTQLGSSAVPAKLTLQQRLQQKYDTAGNAFNSYIYNTIWCRALIGLICGTMFIISIACVILLCVFHSHLLFECSYAEFMIMVIFELVILIFCGYHFFGIYRFVVQKVQKSKQVKYDDLDESRGLLGKETTTSHQEEEEKEEEEESDVMNSLFMKIVFNILKVLAIFATFAVLILFITFTVGTITYQQLKEPQVNGVLKLDNCCGAETRIEREQSGILHVIAHNEVDLYFAQGVAVAQVLFFKIFFVNCNVF